MLTWQTTLITVCVLGIAGLFYVTLEPGNLDPGFSSVSVGTPLIQQVIRVRAAAKVGLRVGDFIDLRAASPSTRFRLLLSLPVAPLTLRIVRGNESRTITVPYSLRGQPLPLYAWSASAGALCALLAAGLLAIRCPKRKEARTLALALATLGLYVVLWRRSWVTPSLAVDAAAYIIWCVVAAMWSALPALCAADLVESPRVRTALWVVPAAISLCVLALNEAYLVGILTGGLLIYDPSHLEIVFPSAALCASLLTSLFFTSGDSRRRAAWLNIAIVPLFTFGIFAQYSMVAWMLMDAWAFVASALILYALLNRQLIDLGFALNRAVIFSCVSVVLLGTFVLFEWILGDMLSKSGRATNVAVSGAIALGLGLSMRFVHTRVDHVVDHLFFRKRHQAESAIRAFADDAPFITDRAILINRTLSVIAANTDALFAKFLIGDGHGNFGHINENDAAILRLRASRRVVNLQDIPSSIEGVLAYPLVQRGDLLGVLVLGRRRSGEAYAPDESEAISYLAHNVATALGAHTTGHAAADNTVVESLRAMRDSIESLRDAIQADRLNAVEPQSRNT